DRGIVEWHAVLRKWAAGPDAEQRRQALVDYLPYESLPMPLLRQLAEPGVSAEAARDIIREAAGDPFYQDATRQGVLAFIASAFDDIDLAIATARRSTIDLQASTISGIWGPGFAPALRDPRFKD